jgi:hypothetical protein
MPLIYLLKPSKQVDREGVQGIMKRGKKITEGDLLNAFELTEKLLEAEEDTRSDDRLLVERYYLKYHGLTTLSEVRKHKEVPSYETIRRARQRIQADGRCLPVQAVTDGRMENQVVFSEVFGS